MTDPLLATLADEAKTLGHLAACADRQLAALRTGALDPFDAAGAETAEAVAALDRAGRLRLRQHADLARALGADEDAPLAELAARLPAAEARRVEAARERVRTAAGAADARCDALAFSLHYAVDLGRETLSAWRDLGAERPAHVYTAAGAAAPAAGGRPLLNQTG
ncbi:flagellar export chaperone FlgN [Rubrivirga litoralis]|uniref:Flagellar export chaperone FlgN n=1 Tax=Rubrivirga litoralis TaxID=3075598 RepID=A0ABU3BR58_9BACT|nr:flagellar export chaperone FlgN [Rubrivirga sp. F394]MDT0631774.1 flagellar export chaperone FlgN [Rubrivirga sp. F394]